MEGVEMALDWPTARLPSQVRVDPDRTGGVVVHMPVDHWEMLYGAAVFGLFILLELWHPESMLALALLGAIALPIGFLVAGFRTWRLRPGTATITYGWGWLAKLGFKQVFVDVMSVRYELDVWDSADGARHNVNLVSSVPRPRWVVSPGGSYRLMSRLQTNIPISGSALTPELVAVARLFAEALGVPVQLVRHVVPKPKRDPWWAAD
jgi:hypothetical protein